MRHESEDQASPWGGRRAREGEERGTPTSTGRYNASGAYKRGDEPPWELQDGSSASVSSQGKHLMQEVLTQN